MNFLGFFFVSCNTHCSNKAHFFEDTREEARVADNELSLPTYICMFPYSAAALYTQGVFPLVRLLYEENATTVRETLSPSAGYATSLSLTHFTYPLS